MSEKKYELPLDFLQPHTRPGESPVVRIFDLERQAVVRDHADCVCEFFKLSRCRVSRGGALLGCQLFNLAPRSKAALVNRSSGTGGATLAGKGR